MKFYLIKILSFAPFVTLRVICILSYRSPSFATSITQSHNYIYFYLLSVLNVGVVFVVGTRREFWYFGISMTMTITCNRQWKQLLLSFMFTINKICLTPEMIYLENIKLDIMKAVALVSTTKMKLDPTIFNWIETLVILENSIFNTISIQLNFQYHKYRIIFANCHFCILTA